jgi:hypothetical protein
MVMAPDNAIAIPFCRTCGVMLVPQLGGEQMSGPCKDDPRAEPGDVVGSIHSVEYRYAHLDPPGMMY